VFVPNLTFIYVAQKRSKLSRKEPFFDVTAVLRTFLAATSSASSGLTSAKAERNEPMPPSVMRPRAFSHTEAFK
jgi:hypothetical protein